MSIFEIALGVALSGFLIVLVFGLLTGRIPWRASGCCCPADPSIDRRMSTAAMDTSPSSDDDRSPTGRACGDAHREKASARDGAPELS